MSNWFSRVREGSTTWGPAGLGLGLGLGVVFGIALDNVGLGIALGLLLGLLLSGAFRRRQGPEPRSTTPPGDPDA